MLGLHLFAVVMCVVSKVMSDPMPQPLWIGDDDEQYQIQNERAIDRFSTKLVGNRRIRENYLDCFLDNGPCSPEASNIKRMIPEAIQKECEHCTELQKKVIEKMMCYLNNHQPEILQQVAAKFDPNGEYMKQYINTLEKKQNQPSLRPQLYQSQQPQNPTKHHQNPQQPQHQHSLQQQPQHTLQNQRPQQGNKCETCDQNYQPQQPQAPPQQSQNPPQHHQNPQLPQHPPQQHQNSPQKPQHPPQQPQNPPQHHQNPPQQPQHPLQQHQQSPQLPKHPQQHQHQSNQYQHSPQQHQYKPQQNDCETCEQNQGHQYQHQHQHEQQHQQQYQHEQQLKTTVVTSSPISIGTQNH